MTDLKLNKWVKLLKQDSFTHFLLRQKRTSRFDQNQLDRIAMSNILSYNEKRCETCSGYPQVYTSLTRKELKFMKYHKSLRNNIIPFFLLLGLLLAGCKKSEIEGQATNNEIEPEVIFNLDKIKEECIQLATSYQPIYSNSEKIISQYIPYEISLPQESIDEIEDYFISKGYSVINSDRKYPSYLENASTFYHFYEDSQNGKEVEQKIISITSDGGMLYTILKSNHGNKYQAIVTVQWNEDNEPLINDAEYHPINDWKLINHTDFYYLTPLKGPMYDVYGFIRLKEVDKSLYDMNEKYILPIGYIFNNMFITDWEYPKYDGLCFND